MVFHSTKHNYIHTITNNISKTAHNTVSKFNVHNMNCFIDRCQSLINTVQNTPFLKMHWLFCVNFLQPLQCTVLFIHIMKNIWKNNFVAKIDLVLVTDSKATQIMLFHLEWVAPCKQMEGNTDSFCFFFMNSLKDFNFVQHTVSAS